MSRVALIVFLAAAGALLAGCLTDPPICAGSADSGAVVRAMTPDREDPPAVRIRAIQDGTTIQTADGDERGCAIFELPAGDYTFWATEIAPEGHCRMDGGTEAAVVEGASTLATIELRFVCAS